MQNLFRAQNIPFYQLIVGDEGILVTAKLYVYVAYLLTILIAVTIVSPYYFDTAFSNLFNSNFWFRIMILAILLAEGTATLFATLFWKNWELSRMSYERMHNFFVQEMANKRKNKWGNSITLEWSDVITASFERSRFVMVVTLGHRKYACIAKLKQEYDSSGGVTSQDVSLSAAGFEQFLTEKLGERLKTKTNG